MAKELTPEQEANLAKYIELYKLYKGENMEAKQEETLEKIKEIRANRTLSDDLVDELSVDVPRVLGRTARSGLEAAGAVADLATTPFKIAGNWMGGNYQTNTYSKAVSDLLPESVFPKPREGSEATSPMLESMGLDFINEGTIDKATNFVASASPFVKGGQLMSNAPGVIGRIGETLSTQPAMQAASAASAGMGGEYARQEGATPLQQFGTSLLTGLIPATGRGVVNATRSLLPPGKRSNEVLATLDLSGLSKSSIDRLRNAIDKATKFGELDEAALERMIDFERVGAQPTQASVTLDPVQKTQQMNLAKTGANSSNPNLQRLAQIENSNNKGLLTTLDDMADNVQSDPYYSGKSAIEPIQKTRGQLSSTVDKLYSSARGTDGRSLPLNRSQFVERTNQLLVENNLIRFLPKEIKQTINDIAYGQVKVKGEIHKTPFNVDVMDSLKTSLAAEQRSAKGSAKAAISMVRQALEETQLQGGASDDAIRAFDKARSASRALFEWEKSAPGIKAVVDGATPETFIDKYILSKTAGVDDVKKLVNVIEKDPNAFNALKFQIAAWIRDKAAPRTVTNAEQIEGKLNSASLTSALKQIGDRKLKLFFSPDEIETMHATSRVAFYDAYQPSGSAVNNANSATTIAGGLLNTFSDNSPTYRAVGAGLRGIDSMINSAGRARQQLNPNLLMGSTKPPLLPALATPMMLPLLPQPNR